MRTTWSRSSNVGTESPRSQVSFCRASSDRVGLFVECEMAGGETVDFGAGHIATERFGLFDLERQVIATPQYE
jgi:hypothetical protein